MSKSDYLEIAMLDHVLKNTAFTQPTVLFVALCTAATTDAQTGATITEVTNANGYARQSAAFDAAAAGATSNTGAIAFTASGGNYNADVTHFAVVDSGTYGAGNVLYHGALSATRTFNDGDTGTFAAGDLDITED